MSLSLRIYTYVEISAMLQDAGFEVESVYGGPDASPFTPESRRMILVARKTQ